MVLQVAGETEAGDNQNNGEDDEEETVDDDSQATPVGLGGAASCLIDNARSVIGSCRVAGADGISHSYVGHHLQRACALASWTRRERRRPKVLLVIIVEVDQKNSRHQRV